MDSVRHARRIKISPTTDTFLTCDRSMQTEPVASQTMGMISLIRGGGVLMRFAVAAAMASLIVGISIAGDATASIRKSTHIPAENLGAALQTLAKSYDVNVVYFSMKVDTLQTQGAGGELTAAEAFSKVLSGTGLTYRYIGDKTVTIVPIGSAGAPTADRHSPTASGSAAQTDRSKGNDGKAQRSFRDRFHMAQVDQGAAAGSDTVETANQQVQGHGAEGQLQEVIVTAQKFRQTAFDVPISLDVISGLEIQQHGITDLSNLQYDVPGLYMDNTGDSHSIYLRGVSNTQGNGPMVGQYINDADVTAETSAGGFGYATGDNALYDLNRVEVLKGPQGTLYGDGSMGGVIRYITNEPVLTRFQLDQDVTALFTEYGAPTQRIETMLNTPLERGKLGLRLAGMFEHDGGWVDAPAANLKNINGSNLVDVRAEVLWQPTENLKINAMQIVHRHAGGLVQAEDSSGNFRPVFNTTLTPSLEDNSNLSNLTVSYDFGVARLESSSTYFNETETESNASFSTPTGYDELIPHFQVNDEDFSEELRLTHAGGGTWQWTVGSFYKHFRDHPANGEIAEYFGLTGSSLSSAFPIPGYDERASSSSWAGFVDTSYTLFGRLTLGAGVRYFEDREEFAATEFGYLAGSSIPGEAASFTSTDPRIYVSYRTTPNINIYASATKGFRSGGFNTPPEPPYQPEVLWNYELGSKLRFPKQGIRADVDLFYMNYSNYLNLVYRPPSLYYLANVGKARIKGADADLTWQPLSRWRFGLNAEILNTEFLTASAASYYFPGDRLPYDPTYSFTGSVRRNFSWKAKPVSLELYYYEISRVQARVPMSLYQSDVLHFLNFRLGITWNENVSLALFAHNLLNDRGLTIPPSSGYLVRPRPRTFGIEIHAKFL